MSANTLSMKEIGRRSRRAGKGDWTRSAALFVLTLTLPISFGILGAVAQLLFEGPQVSGTLYALWTRLPGIVSAFLAVVFGACSLLALAPLRMGQRAWYYGGALRFAHNHKWVTFWYKPKQAVHALRLFASLAARKAGWAALLLAPGLGMIAGALFISYTKGLQMRLLLLLTAAGGLLLVCGIVAWLWVIQRYALTTWLLAKYPKMSVRKAVHLSIGRMEGRYGQSLGVAARMLLWMPLALLIVPLLWLVPYAWQRRAVWAASLDN
jgi:hypothetical protein